MKIYKLLTNQFDISVVMTIYTNIGSNSSAVSPKETRDVHTHTHTHTHTRSIPSEAVEFIGNLANVVIVCLKQRIFSKGL